ncbi:MAG TPA: hypothetical protein VK866_14735 [Acidimicrobiales bacterium]|nr:hypothetical protein [Acidimicrobiales bacterium]
MAAGAGTGSRPDPVDAASDAVGATAVVLVAEGVGECSHRRGADDHEAVAVQERVQLAQRQLTVAAQQGQAHAAEPSPVQRDRIGDERRDRWLVVGGRPSAVLPRDHRVQGVTVGLEVGDEGAAALGHLVELGVEIGQGGEAVVAVDLEPHPGDPVESGVVANGQAAKIEVAHAAGEESIVHGELRGQVNSRATTKVGGEPGDHPPHPH